MSPIRLTCLGLAALGAVLPTSYFIAWLQANGWSLGAMFAAWTVNGAAAGLVWNLTIAAAARTVRAPAESIARRDWLGLVAIPATSGIGLACGLPIYLFLRSRRTA